MKMLKKLLQQNLVVVRMFKQNVTFYPLRAFNQNLPRTLGCSSLQPWPSAQHPEGLSLCRYTTFKTRNYLKNELFYIITDFNRHVLSN